MFKIHWEFSKYFPGEEYFLESDEMDQAESWNLPISCAFVWSSLFACWQAVKLAGGYGGAVLQHDGPARSRQRDLISLAMSRHRELQEKKHSLWLKAWMEMEFFTVLHSEGDRIWSWWLTVYQHHISIIILNASKS